MNYLIDMLELWKASLSETMRDNSMRFPIAAVLGLILGAICWILAGYSARLWNRRFYLKVGLQILCALASLLTIVYTLTFASSDSLNAAVENQLLRWQNEARNDAEWRTETFAKAWDEIARAGTEPDVKKSPSPRTDPSITILPLNNPLSKIIVARSHANAASEYFQKKRPYLASILKPPGSIPDELLEDDLIKWFTENPGSAYPHERGVDVLVRVLKSEAAAQMEPIITYTKRLSLGLLLVTQLLVFTLISVFAYRSIIPTR
jgi:hypothetical protein